MPYQYIKRTQARRIFIKFGGPRRVAAATGHDPSCVYRWDYPKSKGGTGGIVPLDALRKVRIAARAEGILLTDEDLSPVVEEVKMLVEG